MKIVCLLVLIPSLSFAQWTTSGTNIYNANTGNVGIGVTNPGANLQIGSGTVNGLINLGGYSFLGNIRSSGDIFMGMNAFASYGSSSENGLMRVFNTNTSGFSAMHLGYNGDINFFVKNGSVTANDPISVSSSTYNALKIAGSGRVGIGTISPGAQFTVALPSYSGTPVNSSLAFINQSTNPTGADLKPALELNNSGSSGYGLVSLAANNYLSGK